MCNVLKELYRKVYDEAFDYQTFEHRIKLQKAVYILENMGISVGDYSFSWNKYGPYSLSLDFDAQRCSVIQEKNVLFSDFAEAAFNRIRGFIEQCSGYSCVHWMECIASVYYLKYVLRLDDNRLLEELLERKPYLSNMSANQRVITLVSDIGVGD